VPGDGLSPSGRARAWIGSRGQSRVSWAVHFSVRAGGLEWWHVLVLVVLAAVAVALWLLGGRKAAKKPSQGDDPGGTESAP